MKYVKKIFVCATVMTAFCLGDGKCAEIPCLNAISQDSVTFLQPIKNIVGNSKLDQSFVDAHKTDFSKIVGEAITKHCADTDLNNMNLIAEVDYITIPFAFNNTKYDITISTDLLFNNLQRSTAFLVVNDIHKRPGDIIKKSEMPKSYFFSGSCSDHYVRVNLSNKAGVNVAGQSAFEAYGGSNNEFFLDMPVGKGTRAFPGLVLGDFGTFNAAEKIVAYTNYKSARKALKDFSEALKKTTCANQGLAVYLVDIQKTPQEKQSSWWWCLASCPILLVPQKLEDIPQVTILSNPEIIN